MVSGIFSIAFFMTVFEEEAVGAMLLPATLTRILPIFAVARPSLSIAVTLKAS